MRWIKWGGPVVALLLVVFWWFSSTTWIAHLGPGDWQVSAGGGLIGISYWPGRTSLTRSITGVSPPTGVQTVKTPRQFNWWFRMIWQPDRRSVAIPMWIPFVIVVGLTAYARHTEVAARRRALLGHCPKCHYDRRDLAATAPCPECGTTRQIA